MIDQQLIDDDLVESSKIQFTVKWAKKDAE